MALKKKKDEGSPNSFMMLYTNLMMLLMTFFIIFVSMGTIQEERVRVGFAAFREAILTGGIGILLGEKMPVNFDYLIQKEKAKIKEKISSSLEKSLKEEKEVKIISTKKGVALEFPGRILFEVGKAELKPEAENILNKIIPILKDYPYPIQVEGHTDNLPIHTKEFPSNWELSTARAISVIRYLEEKGINKERLSALGYGEYRPLVSNNTPENRAINRRVGIIIPISFI